MADSLHYSDAVLIDAAPGQVYATVSDVTRMGEWSPVCKDCWWDDGDSAQVGAHFTGHNVTADRSWDTRCEVISAEPGVSFGWSVNGGRVFWTYTMAVVDGTTMLTESWEFTPKGQEAFKERYGSQAQEEVEQRRLTAQQGIPATLSAIKATVEREH